MIDSSCPASCIRHAPTCPVAGVKRVVIGLKHPLPHLRDRATHALRQQGLTVLSLSDTAALKAEADDEEVRRTLHRCLEVNDALLHRALYKRPMSLLKYAMTLDGKIATTRWHSSWVSSTESRAKVFEASHLHGKRACCLAGRSMEERANSS